jgi:D-threo-aldose 1-dehydrogenase
LFGVPTKRERRIVLEAAYELGIRHFDVAPIYGLGAAEAELADFIGDHTDVRIATKFGITPTIAGRVAGRTQAPIRRLLRSSSSVKAKLKGSGRNRGAGVVGRVLYSQHNYSTASAQESLAASRRALRVDRLDYFFLHEPAGTLGDDYRRLIDFLERERSDGTIGMWGPAGDLSITDDNLAGLCADAPAHQMPYDLICGHHGPPPAGDRENIAFGFLATSLPRVRSLLLTDPDLRNRCSELLDADLSDERMAVRLLVRDAVTHNKFGTVLVSSTNVSNLRMACQAAAAPFRNEAEVATLIKQNCRALEVL